MCDLDLARRSEVRTRFEAVAGAYFQPCRRLLASPNDFFHCPENWAPRQSSTDTLPFRAFSPRTPYVSDTEADTCRKFVVPRLQGASWENEPHSIAEQRTITDGRIIPVGKGFVRKPPKRVDYMATFLLQTLDARKQK